MRLVVKFLSITFTGLLVVIAGLFAIIACSHNVSAPTAVNTPTVVADDPNDCTDDCYELALQGSFSGTTVTMFGPVRGAEELTLEASFALFEDITGIDIQYEGTGGFEADITTRVKSGNPPDIADFPQPGLLQNFVSSGDIVQITDFLPKSYLEAQYTPAWVEASTLKSPSGGDFVAGVWHRTNGKSQVFYPKKAFESAGYKVPKTWDELVALNSQIVDDGGTPWCIGIESGVATGWPATDWTEDLMLRTTSTANYDRWVAGELNFDSPEVRRAVGLWSDMWFKEGNVFGGREQIVSTFFGDSANGMFNDPPDCYLHRQGNFIVSNWKDLNAVAGVDYDVFYLPPVDSEYGRPYLIAGDLFAMFSDRPEVRAVMEFITKPEAIRPWLIGGGVIAPHSGVDSSWYGSPIDAAISGFIADATAVRFDGSDLMPGQVGAGSFWTEISDYVADNQTLDKTLADIDASWPDR